MISLMSDTFITVQLRQLTISNPFRGETYQNICTVSDVIFRVPELLKEEN